MTPEEVRAYDMIITAILRSPRFVEACAADRDIPRMDPHAKDLMRAFQAIATRRFPNLREETAAEGA